MKKLLLFFKKTDKKISEHCWTSKNCVGLLVYVSLWCAGELLQCPAGIVTSSFKLQVIKYAKENGNRATERHFGPPPTEKMIRTWRRQENELKEAKHSKRKPSQRSREMATTGRRCKNMGTWPKKDWNISVYKDDNSQSKMYGRWKRYQWFLRFNFVVFPIHEKK